MQITTPHRRYNPLSSEWILVSPHRAARPWQGKEESVELPHGPGYDHQCYLCPGNIRVHGEINPDYHDTFVFNNDFQALLPDSGLAMEVSNFELLKLEQVQGVCRVLCFSPRHDLTLAQMEVADILKVIKLWQSEMAELGQKYEWVQIFENKGALMGCSNPHPHGQIWAGNFLPSEIVKENHSQSHYYEQHHSSLLLDYARLELELKERIVCQNEAWLVVVPFWATWPFETLLLPKFELSSLEQLQAQEAQLLAAILKDLLTRYDTLFHTSFPYSMGWHGQPSGSLAKSTKGYWQLHAHFYPPLLRSATVQKFMVGYELLAEAQRDLTPEQAALRLAETQ